MKIKRYILISLLFHLTAAWLFLIFHPGMMEKINEQTKGEKGGTEKDKNSKQMGKSYPFTIIELTSGKGKKIKRELHNYFWGVGITCKEEREPIDGTEIWTATIREVFSGYTAESAGIQVGDKILYINGEPMSPKNSIPGEEPKKLVLTILRGNKRITISLERTKIYY